MLEFLTFMSNEQAIVLRWQKKSKLLVTIAIDHMI